MNQQPILVTDFDGTITQQDFYRLALECLVPPGTPNAFDDYLAGRITHFEAIARILGAIRADETTVLTVVEQMGIDPRLHEAVTRLQAAGWGIIVASAGCHWYIDRLLAAQDVQVTVHANPGTFSPEHGLRMTLPLDSPFFSAETGIDKDAITADAVKHHACVAFAGDGKPDYFPAMRVPPERRFARGWLADYLRGEGIPFRPFTCWSEIAALLLEGTGPC